MERLWKILRGNSEKVLKELPDESVDCCVTSPPYYALRDYGNVEQIGLEESPQEYIDRLVTVFHEVKRVLRNDGTLWVNIGDSYNGSGGDHKEFHKNDASFQGAISAKHGGRGNHLKECKPKDLIGIPWLLAFALRADGWYLRQDIIWAKPNPMPESVTDRCTKSHEYIFLLSKSPKYYFDNVAISEESVCKDDRRAGQGRFEYDGERAQGQSEFIQKSFVTISDTRNKRDVWNVNPGGGYKTKKGVHYATYPMELIKPCILAGSREGGGRSRSVLRYGDNRRLRLGE